MTIRAGEIVWATQVATDLAGLDDPAYMAGRDVFSFVHPDSLAITQQRIAALYTKDADAEWIESRFQRADGSPLPVEVTASRINWRGEPAGLVVFNDISRRKQAERERLALEQRVQDAQRTQSLAVLAGGVAHDFNNLLVGILGNADLALRGLPAQAAIRPKLEGIELAARRAADLAQQMLAYSGKGRFVIDQLDLRQLLEESAHLVEAALPRKVLIRYELTEQAATVRADATQIRQVVLNLVTNAAEALGDEDGEIRLATGVICCKQMEPCASMPGQDVEPGMYAFIEVADNGSGMDEATRRRIFEPFFTTKFTGRGLGLAAVVGIVKGHGGAINVQSEPGEGTRQHHSRELVAVDVDTLALTGLRILATDADAKPEAGPPLRAQAVSAAPAAIRSDHQGTILLVDDEETVREVASAMLEHLGCRVITAEDGARALELFAQHAPEISCVLLDLSMPHMDGRETYTRLRALQPDLRVVLSSGFNEQHAVRRFAHTGLAGFVQKPYQVATLAAAIESALAPRPATTSARFPCPTC